MIATMNKVERLKQRRDWLVFLYGRIRFGTEMRLVRERKGGKWIERMKRTATSWIDWTNDEAKSEHDSICFQISGIEVLI